MAQKSESVWFEQVDTALIEYIQKFISLPTLNGEVEPIPVSVRKPDEDFKIEIYPSITLYAVSYSRHEIRYYPFEITVARDDKTISLIREKGAVPYTLKYQVDFWAKKQSQMNEMLRMWLGYNPERYINLPVKDVAGNDRNVLMLQDGEIVKSDLIDGESRIFHTIITYDIWVALDEKLQTKVPYIKTIEVKTESI